MDANSKKTKEPKSPKPKKPSDLTIEELETIWEANPPRNYEMHSDAGETTFPGFSEKTDPIKISWEAETKTFSASNDNEAIDIFLRVCQEGTLHCLEPDGTKRLIAIPSED